MNRQISIFIIFLTLLNPCSTINRHKANIDDTFIEQIMFTSKRDPVTARILSRGF